MLTPLVSFSSSFQAHVTEARSVAEKLRELEVLELKRSSGGELSCCYLCFQNMEEYQRVQDRCAEIYDLVRADYADVRQGGQDKKKGRAQGQKKAAEAGGGKGQARSRRPRSVSPSARSSPSPSSSPSRPSSSRTRGRTAADGATLSVSASANFADGLKMREAKKDPAVLEAAAAQALIASVNLLYCRNIDGSFVSTLEGGGLKRGIAPRPNLDLPSVKRELSLRWTDIPRKSCQWRILIAVHYISDATLPSSHPLHGQVGCMSYSLGQSVSVLPFINKQRGGEYAHNPLIIVQQMRVHYLLGTLQVRHAPRAAPCSPCSMSCITCPQPSLYNVPCPAN